MIIFPIVGYFSFLSGANVVWKCVKRFFSVLVSCSSVFFGISWVYLTKIYVCCMQLLFDALTSSWYRKPFARIEIRKYKKTKKEWEKKRIMRRNGDTITRSIYIECWIYMYLGNQSRFIAFVIRFRCDTSQWHTNTHKSIFIKCTHSQSSNGKMYLFARCVCETCMVYWSTVLNLFDRKITSFFLSVSLCRILFNVTTRASVYPAFVYVCVTSRAITVAF